MDPEYKNFCISCIRTNLKDLKDTKNPKAEKALINEIKFYCNEIETRI